jgi:glycosyltransferase involved in cell wall biosynthesis
VTVTAGSDAPTRALAVFHVAEMSGAARSLRERLAWLAEEGELEVVVPGPGPAADLYAEIATVTRLDYRALTLPRNLRDAAELALRQHRDMSAFRRRIRASRPELVICATAMLPSVLLAARRERVPAILHAAELLVSRRSPLRRLAGRALVRRAGSAAQAVAACSEAVAAQYRSANVDVEVIYPPISDEFATGDGARFRRRRGIPDDAPLVLCVGSLSAGRGQDVLIEAVARLRERVPGVRGALIGVPFPRAVDFEYERCLRDAAGASGVVLCGFEPRIADAYAAADVVVNPARDPEAFGRVCCEALAASRPVVATRVGAIPEVLRDGETALLVPPGDPAALAGAIERLLSEPEFDRRLAEAGRRDVLERFAPERCLASFKRLVTATIRRSTFRSYTPTPRGHRQ